MIEPSVAIIHNPRAAGGRHGKALESRLREVAGTRGVVWVTTERAMLDTIAREVRERGVRAVAVVGGDGTFSHVLGALQRSYCASRLPPLALLRGGTMNTVANALGVGRRRPERLLGKLLRVLQNPAQSRRATLARGTLSVEGRLGFLFSAGVMAGFLEQLYSERPGRLGALSLLLRGSARALLLDRPLGFESRLDVTLTLDGKAHPREQYGALGAGTVEDVGLGFRPYPQAGLHEDRFQLFAFTGDLRQLATQLPRLRIRPELPPRLGFMPLARSATLHSHAGPLTYALDGELVRTGSELALTSGPTVELIVV